MTEQVRPFNCHLRKKDTDRNYAFLEHVVLLGHCGYSLLNIVQIIVLLVALYLTVYVYLQWVLQESVTYGSLTTWVITLLG